MQNHKYIYCGFSCIKFSTSRQHQTKKTSRENVIKRLQQHHYKWNIRTICEKFSIALRGVIMNCQHNKSAKQSSKGSIKKMSIQFRFVGCAWAFPCGACRFYCRRLSFFSVLLLLLLLLCVCVCLCFREVKEFIIYCQLLAVMSSCSVWKCKYYNFFFIFVHFKLSFHEIAFSLAYFSVCLFHVKRQIIFVEWIKFWELSWNVEELRTTW